MGTRSAQQRVARGIGSDYYDESHAVVSNREDDSLSTVIYHNPRCSKSRATLALLSDRGIDPKIIAYLETPPTKAELRQVLGQLGVAAPDIIRFNEQVAKQAGLTPNDSRSEDEWLELMVANPILIERPIVVHGGQARIGRPPESVLEIL